MNNTDRYPGDTVDRAAKAGRYPGDTVDSAIRRGDSPGSTLDRAERIGRYAGDTVDRAMQTSEIVLPDSLQSPLDRPVEEQASIPMPHKPLEG